MESIGGRAAFSTLVDSLLAGRPFTVLLVFKHDFHPQFFHRYDAINDGVCAQFQFM